MTADVEVRPSEDIDKVKAALEKVLSGSVNVVDVGEHRHVIYLEGSGSSSLERLRTIIQRDRIRTAARAVLSRNIREDSVEVYLNKQVAFAGHISFSEPEGESPLGPIHLIITAPDILGVIDWLTGGRVETSHLATLRTRDGKGH